jgi:hypothetical protein
MMNQKNISPPRLTVTIEREDSRLGLIVPVGVFRHFHERDSEQCGLGVD